MLDDDIGVGLDRDSIARVVLKKPRRRGQKVMPAQASAQKMRVEDVGDLADAKDRAWIFKDHKKTHAAGLIGGVQLHEHPLGLGDQRLDIGGFFLVLELRQVEDQRLFEVPISEEMQREIKEMQRQWVAVEQVIPVGQGEPWNALDGVREMIFLELVNLWFVWVFWVFFAQCDGALEAAAQGIRRAQKIAHNRRLGVLVIGPPARIGPRRLDQLRD